MPFQQVITRKDANPLPLEQQPWPSSEKHAIKVKVLAPHPDDFDAIAVTLKMFEARQYSIELYVLSGGSKGVQDEFLNSNDWNLKARTREKEQLKSTRIFGLSNHQVTFLRMPEAEDGELSDSLENQNTLAKFIIDNAPSIWCLPYGKDSNTAHQRTYRMAKELAQQHQNPVLLLCNKDAKTLEFETHFYTAFEVETANWKAALLRCHDSQHTRNLNLRGHGFDERVLTFNKETAQILNIDAPYAEAFNVELIP